MAKPTCGDCVYLVDGKCSDGGRWFDYSVRRYAGQSRRSDAPACAHYLALRDPAFFYIGGIDSSDPRNSQRLMWECYFSALTAEHIEDSDLSALMDLAAWTGPDAPEGALDALDAKPFLPRQAHTIRTLLAKIAEATSAPQEVVDRAFRAIQAAADIARTTLRVDYETDKKDRMPCPPFELMKELARVRDRGRLSDDPNPRLLFPLLAGAHTAGVLDLSTVEVLNEGIIDPERTGHEIFMLLRSLSDEEVRRAADAAHSMQGILTEARGRPKSTTVVQDYIGAIVEQYRILSGKSGSPVSHIKREHPDGDGKREIPGGPLVELILLCLAPVQPDRSRETVAADLKRLRRD